MNFTFIPFFCSWKMETLSLLQGVIKQCFCHILIVASSSLKKIIESERRETVIISFFKTFIVFIYKHKVSISRLTLNYGISSILFIYLFILLSLFFYLIHFWIWSIFEFGPFLDLIHFHFGFSFGLFSFFRFYFILRYFWGYLLFSEFNPLWISIHVWNLTDFF